MNDSATAVDVASLERQPFGTAQAKILERANRSIKEATTQCERIEAWLAEREAPERRQSFTLIQGGRDESDDA